MKKLFLLTIAYVSVVLITSVVPVTPAAAATPFNPNNLIDDYTFENTATMTANGIDTWLNANFSAASCINSTGSSNDPGGFTTPDPQGWLTDHYGYGGNVTAGKAIYDTAQLYHLNPQVILTTLQKEQSLVTGGAGCYYNSPNPNAPFSSTPSANNTFTCTIRGQAVTCTYACPYSGGCVNIALGYDCPGYCKASNEGFSKQLTLGSWLLRFNEERAYGILTGYSGYETGDENFTYSGPMTAGWRKASTSAQLIYYDGTYTTQDGTSVTIANGATASLYTFTPYVSGNQKFDNIFQGALSDGYLGFGSVIATDTFAPHPNGTLIWENGRVYLLDSGQKRYIANADVFTSYRYQWSQIKPASTGDKNLPLGTPITTLAPGTLFRGDNTPVYVMDYEGGVLKARQVSYAAFTALGYDYWSDVMVVPAGEVASATQGTLLTAAQHPSGSLVRLPGDTRIYLIDQGNLRYILNAFVFESYNYDWYKVAAATTLDSSLPHGTDVQARQGTIGIASGNIYVIDNDTNGVLKRPIGPWECYANRLHYTASDWLETPVGALPSRTGALFTC